MMETRQLHQFAFRAHRFCFLLCVFHLFLTPTRQQLIPFSKKRKILFSAADTNISFLRYAVVHHTSPIAAHSLGPAMRPMTQKVGWYIHIGANE